MIRFIDLGEQVCEGRDGRVRVRSGRSRHFNHHTMETP